MNPDYVKGTKEGYIPDECEHYGFNEVGGKEYKDGVWVDHCQSYRDSLERDPTDVQDLATGVWHKEDCNWNTSGGERCCSCMPRVKV